MKHKIGETCVDERDCYNNNCVDGVCTRKKRKYKKKIGSECLEDKACYSGKCRRGEGASRGRCVGKTRKNKIGAACVASTDCFNKNCVNGLCTRKTRKYKKKLGLECANDNQCYTKNCVDNVCTRRKKRALANVSPVTPRTKTLIDNEIAALESKNASFDDISSQDIANIDAELAVSETTKSMVTPMDKTPTRTPTRPKTRTPTRPKTRTPTRTPTRPRTAKTATPFFDAVSESPKMNATEYTISAENKLTRFSPKSKQITPPNTVDINKFFLVPSTEELLKVHDDLEALGMKQDDFYYDPCYFLKGLTKLIRSNMFRKYNNKMYLLLPIIYPSNKNYRDNFYVKNKMNKKSFVKYIRDARLGENKVDLCFDKTCYIAEGSFGIIYKSKFNGKDIVIKDPKSDVPANVQGKIHNDVFDENLIQSELYCALRGQYGNMARIPKIEFMTRVYMPGSKMKILTGLEKLDGDLFNFMKMIPKMSVERIDLYLKDAFIQLCKLLELLQDKFNFHHRDLHGGNVMYKNIGTASKPVYRWFIIDFGFSYLEKDGVKYHADSSVYGKFKTPNFAHDFRLMFLYLSTYLRVSTDMKKNSAMIRFIFFVATKMNNELVNKYKVNKIHWHNGYDFFDVALITDSFTNPRTLRKMLENGDIERVGGEMALLGHAN